MINDIEYFIISLIINVFLDDEGVDGFAPLHILVNIHEIVIGIVEIQGIVLEGKAKLDDSGWKICKLNFHYFLEIDIAYIVEDPFDFDVGDVDATAHR